MFSYHLLLLKYCIKQEGVIYLESGLVLSVIETNLLKKLDMNIRGDIYLINTQECAIMT